MGCSEVKLELPKRIAENIDRFTGRAWLVPKVLQWWEGGGDRLFLLTGDPGTGKSMIVAWLAGHGPPPEDGSARAQLARLREAVKAVHFCQAASCNITPQAFAESIANQLTGTVTGFGDALAATLADRVQINVTQTIGTVASGGRVTGVLIENGLDDVRSFGRAFTDPLKRLYASGHTEPMLLLVDALDEAQTYTGVSLPDLLSRIADLPAGVRILATTRDEPRVLKLFRGIQPFDLIRDVDPNVNDVQTYAAERLTKLATINDGNRNGFAKRLSKQADGVFLYAAMVLDDLLERPIAELPDLATYPLPKGLSGLYHDFLNRELGKDEPRWFSLYEPLLGLIAVAQGEGLNAAQLTAIIGKDIRAALRATKQYLSGELPDGPFRPFHKSFADFLLQDEENVDFQVDGKATHQRIADYYWSKHGDNWSGCDDYGLAHLVEHLRGAGREKELHSLLWTQDRNCKNAWFASKKERGTSDSYLKDLRTALQVATSELLDPISSDRSATILSLLRYTLIASSLSGVAGSLPPALLKEIVKRKLWRPEVAFAFARRVSMPNHRIASLSAILPHLDTELRRQCYAEAKATIDTFASISGNSDALFAFRAKAVWQLARAASAAAAHEVLLQLWQDCRAWSLDERLVKVLTRTIRLMTPSYEVERVAAFAYWLFYAAEDVAERWVLLDLIVADKRLAELQNAIRFVASQTTFFTDAITVLRSICPLIEASVLRSLVRTLLGGISAETNDLLRVSWLVDLLPLMSPSDRESALEDILSMIASGQGAVDDVSSLLEKLLAIRDLDPSMILEGIRNVKDVYRRTVLSFRVLSLEDEEQRDGHAAKLDEYVESVRKRGGWDWEVLTVEYSRCAGCLSNLRKNELFAKALMVTDDKWKVRAFANLAPYLESESVKTLIPDALKSLRRIDDYEVAEEFFGKAGPHLPTELIQSALADLWSLLDDDMLAIGIGDLVVNLEGEDRSRAVRWAFERLPAADEASRLEGLIALSPYLNEEDCSVAASLAMGFSEPADRIRGACAIVRSSSSASLQERVAEEVLREIESIKEPRTQIDAQLDALNAIRTLPIELADRACFLISQEKALTHRATHVARLRSDWYATKVESLELQLIPVIFSTEFSDGLAREALKTLAPALTENTLQPVVDNLNRLMGSNLRREALPKVARRMAELGRLDEAYEVLVNHPSVKIREEGWAEIAEHVDAAFVVKVLSQCLLSESKYRRDRALCSLCIRAASLRIVEQVAIYAGEISEPAMRSRAFAALAAAAASDYGRAFLEKAISAFAEVNSYAQRWPVAEIAAGIAACHESYRSEALGKVIALVGTGRRSEVIPKLYGLSRALSVVGGPQALLGLLESIDDVRRWWP